MEILSYSQQMFQLATEGHARGIWYWAAVYIFVVCGYSLWFQLRTRSWPATDGKLARLGLRKFGATEWATSDQDYIGDALYTYRVSGTEYQGFRISPWIFVVSHNARFILDKQQARIKMLSNDGVRVYYNPRKPEKSYLIVAGKIGIVVTMIVAVLPAFFYWMEFHSWQT